MRYLVNLDCNFNRVNCYIIAEKRHLFTLAISLSVSSILQSLKEVYLIVITSIYLQYVSAKTTKSVGIIMS